MLVRHDSGEWALQIPPHLPSPASLGHRYKFNLALVEISRRQNSSSTDGLPLLFSTQLIPVVVICRAQASAHSTSLGHCLFHRLLLPISRIIQ